MQSVTSKQNSCKDQIYTRVKYRQTKITQGPLHVFCRTPTQKCRSESQNL